MSKYYTSNEEFAIESLMKIAEELKFKFVEQPEKHILVYKQKNLRLILSVGWVPSSKGVAMKAFLYKIDTEEKAGMPFYQNFHGELKKRSFRLYPHLLKEDILNMVSHMKDKQRNIDEDGYYKMRIYSWDVDRGFGFAKSTPQTKVVPKAFIHINTLYKQLTPSEYGDLALNKFKGFRFRGKVEMGKRGLTVSDIKLI
ncbi:hypothetical protein CQZ91_13430 [Bacillus cereus]|uniref:hypothetical protein n=1 Tax=Bacillus cereus TaxID=1396 RepID=UPI000995C8A1|nr:hypothetical protein [Bacillus cereus]OOZ97607.1 hypothetical protein BHL51_18690 [Bacillus cereus]PRC98125.1 hypothetical protein CQZ92_17065 [Bacillus cereus]PRD03367.1 hypothetical protein CQZ91_13430 [Bacillus cereus]